MFGVVLSSKPIRDEGRLIICRIAVGERERERELLSVTERMLVCM